MACKKYFHLAGNYQGSVMPKKWGIVSGLLATVVLASLLLPQCRTTVVKNTFAETGHLLFFDVRLSYNNTKSCASCHDPRFAFTDGYRRSITANGDQVLHNAPTLLNIATHRFFDLSNPGITSLAQQHQRPLFNTAPVELGATGYEKVILNRLKTDGRYRELFSIAFPGEKEPVNFPNIIRCIAAYAETLVSHHAPYDRFVAGDTAALNPAARKGMALFFSSRTNCSGCHSGPFFTQATLSNSTDSVYANTGLYQQYPAADPGIIAITRNPADEGRFKIPTLRNVAVTGPYMHDGSLNTLTEVLAMYNHGGLQTLAGPLRGDGRLNPHKDKRLRSFALTAEEVQQLISFLHALTDSAALHFPDFQNPFATSGK